MTKASVTNRNYAITEDLWNILNDIYGWQAWEIQIQIKTQNSMENQTYFISKISPKHFVVFISM